ncbi:uroporphyrinogen-III synthase [Neptunomonas sp. XY-337]|uniref:uroporphyrinogen-III synthase n=1 Tax=Neptunomonas sp. XY-337 TaxID=2561897 RepID=UPI0010AA5B2C|nr:uroporphyrinogen-III synthase [Neptunomonas sp. XY-337]
MLNSRQVLDGQRVLVTRPTHQSANQIALLKAAGADPVHLPALQITPVAPADARYPYIKTQMMNLDLYDVVICVSPNAATITLDWIDTYWPQLPVGIQWFAIGKRTAAVLETGGIDAAVPAKGFDSEAMLVLPELQSLENKRVLILRGQGGRATLAETLSARGAQVEYANLYDRTCPHYDADHIKSTIYNPTPSAILITSGEALSNFVKVAQNQQREFSLNSLLATYLVVPSERVAETARELGFTNIHVAQGPDDQAMVNALQTANNSDCTQ